MIAAGIFTLLLILLRTMHRGSWRLTATLYLLSLVAIALLFNHHLTESLGLSF